MAPLWAAGADEDTRLRLNQSIERQAQENEDRLLEDEREAPEELPSLIVNGQEYEVHRNRDDLGRALYVAISNDRWQAAVRFLDAYRQLDDPDPMLVHYAQGKLARVRGELAQAESEFRGLLDLNETFLLGRLELARVLFERHKNREALNRFERIHGDLEPDQAKTASVRRSVDSFLQALDHRRSWQGRIAVGPSYSDNLNRSSESRTCLVTAPNGACFIERSAPGSVEAPGLDYEATLERNVFLSGHHGLFARALAFGNRYRDHSSFNQATYTLNAGYRYRDERDLYKIGPLYEIGTSGNDTLYEAWGLRGEWMRHFSRDTAFKLEGDHKRMNYSDEQYARFDGSASSLYATTWHRLAAGWTLFGGLDAVRRRTEEALSSYLRYGARLGASKKFGIGVETTLYGAYRNKRYDDYNALLEARRLDREQHYTLMIDVPALSFHGVQPALTLEHTRVNSNVDWLYSYRTNAISLKFEYQL